MRLIYNEIREEWQLHETSLIPRLFSHKTHIKLAAKNLRAPTKIFLGGWEKGKKIGGKTLVLVPYHAAAVAKFG